MHTQCDSDIARMCYNARMSGEHEKAVEDMRGHDLSPAMVEKETRAKKTWFFERMGDGKIIAAEQREAWDICYNKSNWKRRDFKLLGTSNGQTYTKIVRESMSRVQQLRPQVEAKRVELQKYMQSEENLITNEAVDMEGDPADTENEKNKLKVLRLRKIIDRINGELDILEDELQKHVCEVVSLAFAAELEVAKENQAQRIKNCDNTENPSACLDWPDKNLNIKTPAGSHKPREQILGILGGRM